MERFPRGRHGRGIGLRGDGAAQGMWLSGSLHSGQWGLYGDNSKSTFSALMLPPSFLLQTLASSTHISNVFLDQICPSECPEPVLQEGLVGEGWQALVALPLLPSHDPSSWWRAGWALDTGCASHRGELFLTPPYVTPALTCVCLDIPGVGLAHCRPVWPHLLKRNTHHP